MVTHDLPPWLTHARSVARSLAEASAAGSPSEKRAGADRGNHHEHALSLLAEGGIVWLTGPPGSGVTTTAAGIAVAWPGRVLAARLTACRTPADVVLVIGEALGALPPGDEASVTAILRRTGPVLIILDDADVADLGGVLDQLSSLAPQASWLLTGAHAPKHGTAVTLSALQTGAPLGLPEGLELELDLVGPPGTAPGLPAKAELLALVGASLPGAMGLPPALLLPCKGGRQALRRSAAGALRSRVQLEPARVASAALPDVETLLALATGAPLRSGFCSDDALILRWLAEVLAEPDSACRASAAAARLFFTMGQPSVAHGLLSASTRRNPRARPTAQALVEWARGDLHALAGELELATHAWKGAQQLLERARDPVLLAAMMRRQADLLAARGQAARAARRYRAARALHLRLDDPAGVAATVRGAADLAVATGEVLSAEMFYDEADATPAGIVESNNRRIGRAGLALAQGDLSRARTLLASSEFGAVSVPLLDANRQRRLAELALREGQHTVAQAAATSAGLAYAELGEGVAQGHTARLAGDIAAAAGKLAEAAAWWQRAIELQVRVRDLGGLRRTLSHAAALEQEAGNGAVAAELRDAVAALAGAASLDAEGLGPGWSHTGSAGTGHTGSKAALGTGPTSSAVAELTGSGRATQPGEFLGKRDIDTQEG